MSGNDQKVKAELEQVARAAMEGARQRGAGGVRARAVAARNVKLIYRDGQPERVEESSQRGLGLHLYLDGRYSACQTNHLEPDGLEKFLDRAVALGRAVAVDPHRQLPDPELYEGLEDRDLGLVDSEMQSITADERHRYAAALDEALRKIAPDSGEGELISVETRYQDSEETLYQVHSDGFEGSYSETQLWGYASVTIKDRGDRRPSGWAVGGSHHKGELASPEEVATQAMDSARAQLGAEPIETEQLPMVLENRTVGRLLSHLLAAISGRALQQRSSFLEGKRDAQVGSEHLDIMDDPFIPGGFGSQCFDSEGMTARPFPIFAKGIFKNPYLDTYYARKLGERPTTGSGSNIVVTPGEPSLDELISGINRGVLVRGFLGGNSNATTGDFSLGVRGTLIESGLLTKAVSEMNIAGNHLELWQRLSAVGNDVYPYSALRTPSLLFDSVQFAGR